MEATPLLDGRHAARRHVQLARLLAAAGRHIKAVDHYEQALQALAAVPGSCDALERQLQADRVETRRRLARSLAALKRREEAVRTYEQLLVDAPEDADAHVNLAALLLMRTDAQSLRDAERHCAEAIARCPALPEAHFNMNSVLRRLERQQEAVDLYWGRLESDYGVRRPRASDYNSAMSLEKCTRSESTGPETTDTVAVLCVKWGVKYGPEYVNKLYRSLTRQCSATGGLRLEVICLTDDETGIDTQENLHCLKLEEGWRGWWNKCQVFTPQVSVKLRALGTRRCVYLDLDTVIVGDISELLSFQGGEGLGLLKTDGMANEQRTGGFNSSVMVWSIEEVPQLTETVYELLKEHFAAISSVIYKFDHWLEMVAPQAALIQDIVPGHIVEYCSLMELKDGNRALPANSRVVCFPLRPKPHEATASWIDEFWR